MAEYGIHFTPGFSLNEALPMLEEEENQLEGVKGITIFPPENACGTITDEDSGEEDYLTINNLPGSQLRAPAEVDVVDSDSDFSSDDEIPLCLLKTRLEDTPQANAQPNKNTKKSTIYKWVKEDLQPNQNDFITDEIPECLDSPADLFFRFLDDEILSLLVNESNRYAQQRNRTQEIQKSEMMSFIGVLILSGYVQVPRRRLFWEREKDTHNDLVSDAISRDKFEYILSNIHLANNEELDKNDKFAKVRPLFRHINKRFLEHANIDQMHCVDEAMVPYFGRHGCKQFIHGKPIRYGYKLWVGATRLGYINWIEPYQGSSTNISRTYSDYGVGAGVVLEYADVLRKRWPGPKFHIFCDNFFTSIPLIQELTNKGLYATGTVRENRLPGNTLMDSKLLKRQKRGDFDFQKLDDQNIIAVKWHDNSIVCLASNFGGVQPTHLVKRYSQKEKKSIQVQQPHLIHLYNANMGGVDRSDQNISLYRTSIRGKKWYFSLASHCLDMMVHNAWQLHRQFGGSMDQLKFRRRIATVILTKNQKKNVYNKGHLARERMGNEVRYDRLDHLVIPQSKQTRCGLCHERATTRCSKCDVAVHVKCFVEYHTH